MRRSLGLAVLAALVGPVRADTALVGSERADTALVGSVRADTALLVQGDPAGDRLELRGFTLALSGGTELDLQAQLIAAGLSRAALVAARPTDVTLRWKTVGRLALADALSSPQAPGRLLDGVALSVDWQPGLLP